MYSKLKRPLLLGLGAVASFALAAGTAVSLSGEAVKADAATSSDFTKVTSPADIQSGSEYYLCYVDGGKLYGMADYLSDWGVVSDDSLDWARFTVTAESNGSYSAVASIPSSDSPYYLGVNASSTKPFGETSKVTFEIEEDGSIYNTSSGKTRYLSIGSGSSGNPLSNYISGYSKGIRCYNYTADKRAYFYEAPTSATYESMKVEGDVPTQYIGLPFDYEGLTFTAVFDDQSEVVADSSQITWDPYILTEDTTKVVGNWKGNEFEIEVAPVKGVVAELVVMEEPTKTTYKYSQPLDLSGISVWAEFEDGGLRDVSDFITTDPAEGTPLNELGEQTVEVTYLEGKTSFAVTVEGSLAYTFTSNDDINIDESNSWVVLKDRDGLDYYYSFDDTNADDTPYIGFDSNRGRGLQFGSAKHSASYVKLRTSFVALGTQVEAIKSVSITATAPVSGTTITARIGDEDLGTQTMNGTNNQFFTFDVPDSLLAYGHVEFELKQPENQVSKAFYIKDVSIDLTSDSNKEAAQVAYEIEQIDVCDTSNKEAMAELVTKADSLENVAILEQIQIDDFANIGQSVEDGFYENIDQYTVRTGRMTASEKLEVIRSVANGALVWNFASPLDAGSNEAVIAASVASGIFLAAIAVGSAVIIKKRKSRI